MEPKEEVEALKVPSGEVGLIKEGPVKRWLVGQEAYDKKYKHRATKIAARRKHYEAKANRLLEHAREQGLQLKREEHPQPVRRLSTVSYNSVDDFEHGRRWGTCQRWKKHA